MAPRRATRNNDMASFPLRGPRGIFLEGLLEFFPITRQLLRVIKAGYLCCHSIDETCMVPDFNASIYAHTFRADSYYSDVEC